MKKTLVSVLLVLVVSLTFSQFSIGVMVGQPSGLSARWQMSENLSLDLGAAYSFLWTTGIHIHVDGVFFDHTLLRLADRTIPVYFGVGARYLGAYWGPIGITTLSARVPVGVLYPFQVTRDVNLEIFAEVAPTIMLIPAFDFDVSFAFGVRYRF